MGEMDEMMDMPMNMTMHMRMTFFFGFTPRLLFSTWRVETPGELVGTIIVVLLIAGLYEGLKTLRDYLLWKENKRLAKKQSQIQRDEEDSPLLSRHESRNNRLEYKGLKNLFLDGMKRTLRQYKSPAHILQSVIHVVQVGIAYMLMLVAMSYNGWLFLAVCFGSGIGYYLFGAFRSGVFGDQSDHCH